MYEFSDLSPINSRGNGTQRIESDVILASRTHAAPKQGS